MKRAEINGQKLNLTYPIAWAYKAIGTDRKEVEDAIRNVTGKRECIILPSNKSRSGKYVSVGLEIVVTDEKDRTDLFRALQSQAAIKMVL